jgi:hypothetical protein
VARLKMRKPPISGCSFLSFLVESFGLYRSLIGLAAVCSELAFARSFGCAARCFERFSPVRALLERAIFQFTMATKPIQLTDAAFLMLRKALGHADSEIGLWVGAADIVPAAELIEAGYATVHNVDERPELRATPAGVKYMKMIDALTKPEADAMRDDFGEKLLKMKGSVDPTLKLGF